MAFLRIALLALLLTLAACGGEQTATGCPDAAPSPLPTPPYNDDPELAERLPAEINGEELEIQTACATIAGGGGLNMTDEFLETVGVERSDVTMAVSQPPEVGEDSPYVAITAWRYADGEEEQIRSAFLQALESAEIEVEEVSMGGKDVHRALFAVYHVADDTLYSVIGEDPQIAEVLEALP